MLNELERPEGTVTRFYPGFFPQYNINNAVQEAFKLGLDWIFIIDDDQILPPDTLLKLLAHDKDICVVNLLYRTPPFNPYLYESSDETGAAKGMCLEERSGLVEVAACGTGGILIKTKVFEKLEQPYFTHDNVLATYDLYFCMKAKQAGFQIYCDLNAPSGHIVTAVIWPLHEGGKWRTGVVINNDLKIDLPAAYRDDSTGTIRMKP